MTSAAAPVNRISDSTRWERAVPVYRFPLVNGFFLGLLGLVVIALGPTGYRELAGLGPGQRHE